MKPLIEDPKIRNLVLLWADINNNLTCVQYDNYWCALRTECSVVSVWEELPLVDGKLYTIAELCGEEE